MGDARVFIGGGWYLKVAESMEHAPKRGHNWNLIENCYSINIALATK